MYVRMNNEKLRIVPEFKDEYEYLYNTLGIDKLENPFKLDEIKEISSVLATDYPPDVINDSFTGVKVVFLHKFDESGNYLEIIADHIEFLHGFV